MRPGITLLHVRFHDRLDAATMRGVLSGYDRRYDRLVDWVSETEGTFDDHLLGRAARRRAADRADLRRPPTTGGSSSASGWRTRDDRHRGRRGRHRAVPAFAGPHARRCASGCSRRAELEYVAPKVDPVPSLAARFAAREAVMKSLGVGLGAFGFHDVWVEVARSGAPSLQLSLGQALDLADRAAWRHWHISPDPHGRHGGHGGRSPNREFVTCGGSSCPRRLSRPLRSSSLLAGRQRFGHLHVRYLFRVAVAAEGAQAAMGEPSRPPGCRRSCLSRSGLDR